MRGAVREIRLREVRKVSNDQANAWAKQNSTTTCTCSKKTPIAPPDLQGQPEQPSRCCAKYLSLCSASPRLSCVPLPPSLCTVNHTHTHTPMPETKPHAIGIPPPTWPLSLGCGSRTSRRSSCWRCAASARATRPRQSSSGPTRAAPWSALCSSRGTAPCSGAKTQGSCVTLWGCSPPRLRRKAPCMFSAFACGLDALKYLF